MKVIKEKSWVFLLVLSFVFMGIGLVREEQVMVFKKAMRICLECIGVG